MRAVIGIRNAHPTVGSISHPAPTIWFDSLRQLAGVLSDENRDLLRLIHEREPRTMLELAVWSGRAASNLSRTLHNLESHGLVRLNRSADSRAVRPEALVTEFLVVLS